MLIGLLIGWLLLRGHGGDDLSFWFFGAQTAQQMTVQLESAVPEPTRTAVNQTLSQIEQDYKNLQSQRSSLEKEVLSAMEQHDTPREKFDAFQTRADSMNATETKNMLDLRFKLRGQLTEVQWGLLFTPPAGPRP